VGELYTGGAGLARGYLNRPEMTAERFVPDPYSAAGGGERLYRTGDRARWREDGNLEFMGREDDQVKLRGYRIELGEVEEALRRCRGVKQAVVAVQEGKGGDRRLVGYVAGEEGMEGREVREELKRRLPEYMVPGAVVVVKEMPLTENGKIDRRRLPEARGAGGEWGEEGERREKKMARTPVEEIVAGIWGEVLEVEGVGVEEDFFELGGHSLLATQVIARVRSVLQVEMPLRALFEEPTVAGMTFLRSVCSAVSALSSTPSPCIAIETRAIVLSSE